MKTCGKCGQEKDLTEFNKNSRKSDGLQTWCKCCNKTKLKTHYQNNKSDYRERNKNRKLQLRQFVFSFLKKNSCVDCGESDPIVLGFDHLSNKSYGIAEMVSQAKPLIDLQAEIEKCEIRCSNCHKRKTAKQFDWYKDCI